MMEWVTWKFPNYFFWWTFNIQALPTNDTYCTFLLGFSLPLPTVKYTNAPMSGVQSLHLLFDTPVMESLYLVYASILQSSDMARISATAQCPVSTQHISDPGHLLLSAQEKRKRIKVKKVNDAILLFIASFLHIHNLEYRPKTWRQKAYLLFPVMEYMKMSVPLLKDNFSHD